MHRINVINNFLSFVIKQGLQLVPLYGVENKQCCCGNENCSSAGKHPFYKTSWKKVASSDRKTILGWGNEAQINFGVVTGKRAINNKYLVIIDVDKHNHPILEQLPETLTIKTGSGGYHFWYWSEKPIPNSVGLIADYVDIRGENGYAVIPPSKNLDGSYFVIKDVGIAQLPSFIFEKYTQKSKRATKKIIRTTASSTVNSLEKFSWRAATITEIRSWLSSGIKIPIGLRNTTIHRLLSSDRAKGFSKAQLILASRVYKQQCENSNEVSLEELNSTITQVMRYKPYNTSYEKVNEVFFQYKEFSIDCLSDAEKKSMILLDNDFFHKFCRVASEKNSLMSLRAVEIARNNYMSAVFRSYSKYPPTLLAGKLRSLGYRRVRTARGNLWNIEISPEINQFKSDKKCAILKIAQKMLNVCEVRKISMTTKIENTTIKIKLKKHPNAPRYPGRPSRDTLIALTDFLSKLTPEQTVQLGDGFLDWEPEATFAYVSTILPKDKIGLAVQYDNGWVPTIVSVEEIDLENKTILAKDLYTEDDLAMSFGELSISRALGFFEILYRDDKPYGLPEEQEIKVRIHYNEEDATTSEPSVEPTSCDSCKSCEDGACSEGTPCGHARDGSEPTSPVSDISLLNDYTELTDIL